jgi:hypothetical protein
MPVYEHLPDRQRGQGPTPGLPARDRVRRDIQLLGYVILRPAKLLPDDPK